MKSGWQINRFNKIAVTALLVLFAGQACAGQERPQDTENIRYFSVRSELLSEFWGHDIYIEAGIILPPGHKQEERLPICINIHGFGGSYRRPWRSGQQMVERMRDEGYPRMIYVFPQGQFEYGHHVYCGLWDTFRLEGAVILLKKELEELGSDALIVLVEGRDHGTLNSPHEELWPDGLYPMIHHEMIARFNNVTGR